MTWVTFWIALAAFVAGWLADRFYGFALLAVLVAGFCLVSPEMRAAVRSLDTKRINDVLERFMERWA